MGPWGIFLSLPVPDARRSASLISVVSVVPRGVCVLHPGSVHRGAWRAPGAAALAGQNQPPPLNESPSALERRVRKAAGVAVGMRSRVLLMGSVVGPQGTTPAPPDSP